ncbi:MAG: uroporphyrinogen-III C-methyltransferase [Armatimonadetes bacterium]|nr:uroporphyrinogen-III C-methyltransferase [Armatimonadota bacterium]MDE2207022.1 uroporphyrinogen-III C-methyltransferase [Armatimonadota bacterium]
MSAAAPGLVWLVGAGPGDPDLITALGSRLLGIADVVVYDAAVQQALIDAAPVTAERIPVAASGDPAAAAGGTAGVLVSRALQGKSVVRLFVGDPFVFSCGAEEALACAAAGVEFRVVPGICVPLAAATCAGIPLTHRDVASCLTMTAAEVDAANDSLRAWRGIAEAADTLVFPIAAGKAGEFTRLLTENGRDRNSPVAFIHSASLTDQRVTTSTLGAAGDLTAECSSIQDVVCVVGDAVRLRESLKCSRERKGHGLSGRRIVVTRSQDQAGGLAADLIKAGADVELFACIRIEPLDDYTSLDRELLNAAAYRWVVFTSPNAVEAVAARLDALHCDARLFASSRIAAIGQATGAALRRCIGLLADFTPRTALAEGLIDDWPDRDFKGMRVLLPRAVEARPLLPQWLEEQGVSVTVAACYRTVPAGASAANLCQEIAAGRIDAITFASASTVRAFAAAIESNSPGSARLLLKDVALAAIGPVTADALHALGLTPSIVATEHSIAGLVAKMEEYFGTVDHHAHAPPPDVTGDAQPGS